MSLEEEKDHHFNELLTLIEKFSQLCISNKKMHLATKLMWKYNVFLVTNERTKGSSLIQQKARKEKRNG